MVGQVKHVLAANRFANREHRIAVSFVMKAVHRKRKNVNLLTCESDGSSEIHGVSKRRDESTKVHEACHLRRVRGPQKSTRQ